MSEHTQETIKGLRDLADFLESHPQTYLGDVILSIPCDDKAEFLLNTKDAGSLRKNALGDHFYLRKSFGSRVAINWFVGRDQVCEKIVTQRVMPAEPEKVVPGKPERIEEIVSWECPPSLLELAHAE